MSGSLDSSTSSAAQSAFSFHKGVLPGHGLGPRAGVRTRQLSRQGSDLLWSSFLGSNASLFSLSAKHLRPWVMRCSSWVQVDVGLSRRVRCVLRVTCDAEQRIAAVPAPRC